ncbi:Alpha-N-methyltransferase NTM [Trema orientale]|uniref:Alpha N-terminal protein methyltransferase 1 n=1 Tax=Trema orientale TaxID=63057 RepID=A0A2P5BMF0_TREOI|nr:Alpha-N-methyltransferase NTM [Trema orientale]
MPQHHSAICPSGVLRIQLSCSWVAPLLKAPSESDTVRSRTRVRASMEVGGLDSEGRQFKNADEMWTEHVGDPTKKTEWYRQGVGYWEGVEASVDGVLGGYGHVNDADIKGSEAFLNILLSERFPKASAATSQRHLVALGTLSLFLSV